MQARFRTEGPSGDAQQLNRDGTAMRDEVEKGDVQPKSAG
jgi:hypothetical protein